MAEAAFEAAGNQPVREPQLVIVENGLPLQENQGVEGPKPLEILTVCITATPSDYARLADALGMRNTDKRSIIAYLNRKFRAMQFQLPQQIVLSHGFCIISQSGQKNSIIDIRFTDDELEFIDDEPLEP